MLIYDVLNTTNKNKQDKTYYCMRYKVEIDINKTEPSCTWWDYVERREPDSFFFFSNKDWQLNSDNNSASSEELIMMN